MQATRTRYFDYKFFATLDMKRAWTCTFYRLVQSKLPVGTFLPSRVVIEPLDTHDPIEIYDPSKHMPKCCRLRGAGLGGGAHMLEDHVGGVSDDASDLDGNPADSGSDEYEASEPHEEEDCFCNVKQIVLRTSAAHARFGRFVVT